MDGKWSKEALPSQPVAGERARKSYGNPSSDLHRMSNCTGMLCYRKIDHEPLFVSGKRGPFKGSSARPGRFARGEVGGVATRASSDSRNRALESGGGGCEKRCARWRGMGLAYCQVLTSWSDDCCLFQTCCAVLSSLAHVPPTRLDPDFHRAQPTLSCLVAPAQQWPSFANIACVAARRVFTASNGALCREASSSHQHLLP